MTENRPLPFTCQAARVDGGLALEKHRETCPTCREPELAPEIEPDALFDLPAEPPRGGQHP